MKTEKEHSDQPLLDILVVVIAWIIVIALVYTVISKIRILTNN